MVTTYLKKKKKSQVRILGTLVGNKLKFWNWSSFDHFRQWIYKRRTRTTTLATIPVYIVNNTRTIHTTDLTKNLISMIL